MPRASKIGGGASQKMDADPAAVEQNASLNPANASSTSAPRASQMGGGLATASQKTAAGGDTTEQNAVDLNPNAAVDDQQQPASSAKITGSAGSNAATSAKITGSAGSNAAASAKVAGSTGSNAAASTKMGSGSTNEHEQSPLVHAGGWGAYGYGYATTQQNGQPFDATNAAAGGDGTSQMGSSLKDYWERYMVLWIVIICILAYQLRK